MKNKTIKLTTLLITATLLQSCASQIAKEVAIDVGSDMAADEIRTWFSKSDFGPIDDSLKGKKSIYVSAEIKHGNPQIVGVIGESKSAQICKLFKEKTQSLKTQYKCYIVPSSGSAKRIKTTEYAIPKADGVYLNLGPQEYQGVLTGSVYSITYKNMSNDKVREFTSPSLYKRSQSVKYAAEYLTRLAQKANE